VTDLSPTMLAYLRAVYEYTEGDGDPNTSWVIGSGSEWQRTEAALSRRGLIEENPRPRRERDRQSVRLTDLGREVLEQLKDRKTRVVERGRARARYKYIWEQTNAD
jgi:Mn-dependent DtxR family transcriptional regulator